MKFTLVIDGHNFFFRNLWGSQNQSKTKTKALSTQDDIDTFEKTMLSDFANIIYKFQDIISDVVFIEDTKSWRKTLQTQKEYKGNRKTQDTIDFTGFEKATKSFTQVLTSIGIKYSKVTDCEGDDLIFSWVTHLRNNNISSIILSTDRDLTQLVGCVDDVITIQYNSFSKNLYLTEDTKQSLFQTNTQDIFKLEFEDAVKSKVKTFINSCTVVVTNPEYVRFEKVVSGDSSDNIASVYPRIGGKTAEKIYNAFKDSLNEDFTYKYYYDNTGTELLADTIYSVCKVKDPEFNKEELVKNINTNCQLVVLAPETLPPHIITNMKKNIEELDNHKISMRSLTKSFIYSKSRFGSADSGKPVVQMTAGTLKDIKADTDLSFITD